MTPLSRRPRLQPLARRDLKLRNGQLLHSGPGILSLIIVLYAVITSWTCVLNVKPIRPRPLLTSAQWPGEFAITPFIFTVSQDGSRLEEFVRSTIVNGNSNVMETSQEKTHCINTSCISSSSSSLTYNKNTNQNWW